MPEYMLDTDTVSFVCNLSISPRLGAAEGASSAAEARRC